MIDDNLTPDPDTDTNDDFGAEGYAQPAIPVAEASSDGSEPAVYTGPPRPFPEQYTLLMSNVLIVVGCLTLWEREHVLGRDFYGFQSIGGSLTLSVAFYSMLTSIVGLLRGGVKFFGSLTAGFLALVFGLRQLFATIGADGFKYYEDYKPTEGFQGAVNAVLGQVGPGLYLSLAGGGIMIVLFLKAMFGGKKEATPQPRRRR